MPFMEIFPPSRIPSNGAINGSTIGRRTAATAKPIFSLSLEVSKIFTMRPFQPHHLSPLALPAPFKLGEPRIAVCEQTIHAHGGIHFMERFTSHNFIQSQGT
jgi:hypothetical protein